MLVLSRKIGEKIVIDGGIVVVVKRIGSERVVLGIEAPQDVHIARAELEPLASPPPRNVRTHSSSPVWPTSDDPVADSSQRSTKKPVSR